MTVTEKSAYLRGLFEGLDLDDDKDTTKIIKAMLDVIDDLSLTVSDLEDEVAMLTEQVDAVDDDCCCDDEDVYEVDCPACGETVFFDGEDIDAGFAACPACGEKLEFELEDCDCDCGCDCDCDEGDAE